MRFVAGRGAVAERHREDGADRGRRGGAPSGSCCWPGRRGRAAGRGTGAERHREDVAGRGAVAAEMLLSRTLLAEKTQGCIGKLLLAGDA